MKNRPDDVITVRDSCATHIARWRGKTASCTAGPQYAACACAKKVLGHDNFALMTWGQGYWQVMVTNKHGN
jgi:hypothetical protein